MQRNVRTSVERNVRLLTQTESTLQQQLERQAERTRGQIATLTAQQQEIEQQRERELQRKDATTAGERKKFEQQVQELQQKREKLEGKLSEERARLQQRDAQLGELGAVRSTVLEQQLRMQERRKRREMFAAEAAGDMDEEGEAELLEQLEQSKLQQSISRTEALQAAASDRQCSRHEATLEETSFGSKCGTQRAEEATLTGGTQQQPCIASIAGHGRRRRRAERVGRRPAPQPGQLRAAPQPGQRRAEPGQLRAAARTNPASPDRARLAARGPRREIGKGLGRRHARG